MKRLAVPGGKIGQRFSNSSLQRLLSKDIMKNIASDLGIFILHFQYYLKGVVSLDPPFVITRYAAYTLQCILVVGYDVSLTASSDTSGTFIRASDKQVQELQASFSELQVLSSEKKKKIQ